MDPVSVMAWASTYVPLVSDFNFNQSEEYARQILSSFSQVYSHENKKISETTN